MQLRDMELRYGEGQELISQLMRARTELYDRAAREEAAAQVAHKSMTEEVQRDFEIEKWKIMNGMA